MVISYSFGERRKKKGVLPLASEIEGAKAKTGFFHVKIASNEPKIAFNTEGVLLDFGGIVKGYAAQEAVDILKKKGFSACLADAGGDIFLGDAITIDAGQRRVGWQIAVGMPQSDSKLFPQMLNLKNQAIATSGDMYNFIEINGLRYSHIVDPKTGLGLTHQRNVTVIAPEGATADWLATACSVLSIKKARRLIKKCAVLNYLY
ncbi:MAG: FAD:protein FMN transferase [Saprospiraceae bacterium]|nr:FAD:protein FMN transferase [Saprospiraceae bacterium]